MAEMNIDRLALKLSGMSESDGQRLAQLIAEGLASAALPTAQPRHIDALRVFAPLAREQNTTTSAGSNVDTLSKHIVAEILRQLESTL